MIEKIRMENITKEFGNIVANDDVTIDFNSGEIHALLGENGAGKSTLMSILFGLYVPEKGSIFVNDEKVEIKNPNDANKYHIGMVHQHFKLIGVFTVFQNIILGVETSNKYGFIQVEAAKEKIKNLMDEYQIYVDIDKKINDLTVGEQQKVEILKMLYRDSDVLIFDEPTAVLTPQEIDDLIVALKEFKKKGKVVILITHKLNEIKTVADKCSVLKRGKLVDTVDVKKTSIAKMAEMMVGRVVNFKVDKKIVKAKEKILEVENLSLNNNGKKVSNVSFNVKGGEILGIAGIDGNGQSELVYAITGLMKFDSGKVIINDSDVSKLTVRDRYQLGMAYIPEDRQKHGLILDFSLADNLVMKRYYKQEFQKHGFLKFDEINDFSQKLVDEFDVRSSLGIKSTVRSMSGGNQQKAILAREVSSEHNLLIAVQPTRGLDVGAIENIHKNLIDERNEGKAILLVSLELDEIVDLSDRIIVLYNGEVVANLNNNPKVDMNELGLYMSGAKKQGGDKDGTN